MAWPEFNALDHSLLSIPKENSRGQPQLAPGVDASAIHGQMGRSGCTPAEPYPPNCANTINQKRKNFQTFTLTNHIPVFSRSRTDQPEVMPVGKPATRQGASRTGQKPALRERGRRVRVPGLQGKRT